MKMKEEWVSPGELLHALDGDAFSNRQAVLRRLSAGMITAIADAVSVDDVSAGPDIPPELWASTTNRVDDWVTGDFAAGRRDDMRGGHCYAAFGVRFSKADAIKMGANFMPKRKGIGGAPVQHDKWDLFYMTVLDISRGGRLNASVFPSEKELRSEILERMAGNGHAEDSISPKVKQI